MAMIRRKRWLYAGSAVLGATLGAAGIATAATNGSSSAAAANGAGEADDTPSYQSSVIVALSVGEHDNAALAAVAKITAEDAKTRALVAVPGTVTKVELEQEHGNVVYVIEIQGANGPVDVTVDAGNGTILAQANEPQGSGR